MCLDVTGATEVQTSVFPLYCTAFVLVVTLWLLLLEELHSHSR